MKTPDEYWSIENMEEHVEKPFGRWNMTVIDEVIYGRAMDHKTVYMADPAGMGWYETQVLAAGRWVPMENAVFGHAIRRKQRPA